MSGVRYTEVGVIDYGDFDESHPDGWRAINSATTTEIDVVNGGVFGEAVAALVRREADRDEWVTIPKPVLMTAEACWSGYSEYTITNQWTEVVIGVPAWNMERHYDSMPAFFAALGEATADKAPH